MATGNSIKPWKLTESETISSYNDWQVTIVTAVRQNEKFRNFSDVTKDDSKWKTLDSVEADRGLTADENDAGAVIRSAAQKAQDLNQMLSFIGSKAPHYLFNDILRESDSLKSVWCIVRSYYGFITSEADFLKGADISLEPDERPERFYRRLRANTIDNLLKSGGLVHNGKQLTEDEKLSPTTERHIVREWLKGLHPRLPDVVCRQYATELQTKSLKDLQPAISIAMDSLLAELNAEEARSHYIAQLSAETEDMTINMARVPHTTGTSTYMNKPWRSSQSNSRDRNSTSTYRPRAGIGKLFCKACSKANRPCNHHPMSCDYICEADKRILRLHMVQLEYDEVMNEMSQPGSEPE